MSARCVTLVAVLMAGLTGCQSYQRQPLKLAEYAATWSDRSLDVESISSFAASLADQAGAPAPFDASDGLSLHEGEAVALHFNPRLRLARAQAGVPLAGAKEAGWNTTLRNVR